MGEFYQTFKEEIALYTVAQKTEEKGTIQLIVQASIALVLKPKTVQENARPDTLLNGNKHPQPNISNVHEHSASQRCVKKNSTPQQVQFVQNSFTRIQQIISLNKKRIYMIVPKRHLTKLNIYVEKKVTANGEWKGTSLKASANGLQ